MMKSSLNRLVPIATFFGATALASAQGGWIVCRPADPNTAVFSTDYAASIIQNDLFRVTFGASGTTTYGSTAGFCFNPGITANAPGGIGFSYGPIGSSQTDADNDMALTFGAPLSAGGNWSYASVLVGDTLAAANAAGARFGAAGFSTLFTGASDTYIFARTTIDDIQISLRIDIVADSGRLDWSFQNNADATRYVGLWYGAWVALLTEQQPALSTGGPLGGDTYITVPGLKPLRVEQRFRRTVDQSLFPAYANFTLSQQLGYGLRVENSPTDATTDPDFPLESQTPADEFVAGNSFFLNGAYGGNNERHSDVIFFEPKSDTLMTDDSGFIQKWYPQPINPGATRRIIAYYRSTWGDALYGRPYSMVVDTPKVINLNPTDPSRFSQNPFNIRVYVDNNRGFATVDREIQLEDVRVTLSLPSGLTVQGGPTRVIPRINPRAVGFVDFTVTADDTVTGELTYQVRVEPNPGPAKTLNGTIRAVSQPRLVLRSGANLVASPWSYSAPVWEEILGLEVDSDFQAFAYDPEQKGYIPQTGPERGRGSFIISRQERGFLTLQGGPTAPTDGQPQPDGSGGAPLIRLRSGWNLIGNPYPVAIQLGQIIGATNADSTGALTYSELVQRGYIGSSLAYWDNITQTYRFIDRATDRIEAQRGYWIFVNTNEDLILRFPPVYELFVREEAKQAWTQSDKQWRLQLVARTDKTADDQNFVGVASSAENAQKLVVNEPPIAPVDGAVSLAIRKDVAGQPSRMAQVLSEKTGRQEFVMTVEARDAGPVTLTWPNLSTIPKNVRARIVDVTTGDSRDLRKNSGYTFQADARSTREFKVQLEPGYASRAVIGSVVVRRDGRGDNRNAPVVVSYTLGADATTSVRVLSANGREVFAVTRGRADKAGQNSVTWNLRDNANRAVAPGTYQVEILAESDGGERVRRYVPVTVTR